MVQQENRITVNVSGSRLEKGAQGTPDYPCAGYFADGTEKDTVEVPWHYHSELEYIHVLAGEKQVDVPGHSFHMQAGDGLLLNAGTLHHFLTAPKCVFHSLVFSPALLYGSDASVLYKKYIGPLLECGVQSSGLLAGGIGWKSRMNELFEAAFSAHKQEEPYGFEFVVREKLSACCTLLLDHTDMGKADKSGENSRDNARVCKMLDYIHQHSAENISLGDIAQAANIGTRECCRCFRRTIFQPPMQYLLRYRIQEASRKLILNPDWTIANVAVSCGIASPSYFTALYRRYFACTPQEYRALFYAPALSAAKSAMK